MRALYFVILGMLSACATANINLAPEAMRSKTYEFKTTHSKKEGFVKVSAWAAKTFNNANETVKMKDADAGIFIAKGNIPCDAVRLGNGFASDERADLTLQITVSEKAAKIEVSDVTIKAIQAWDDGKRPSNQDEANKVFIGCIDSFVEGIKKELM